MNWKTEKTFEYKGYECIITYASYATLPYEGWRCGYVVINEDVVDTESIKCHGGITCYGYHDRLKKSVIGFDCAHLGDSLDKCTLEYCEEQCRSIVDQLLER